MTMNDVISTQPVLEVEYNGTTVLATPELFNSWTGPRLINGRQHHGPVYRLDDGSLFNGPRQCPCPTCQATVAPQFKHN